MRYFYYLLFVAVLGALQGCFPFVAAGMGGGAMMAGDRRTTGTYIEDEGIEIKASNQISTKYKDAVHYNITSFNRHVLVTGEAPDEATKVEIGKLVGTVENVKAVTNELTIAGQTGMASRSSDALITSNVKLRFVGNKAFNADHVKVITENGVVYLMGMVYHKEADAATEVASTTGGVQRVVKVFEYLD
jgi:osmotically-inducible protein OsmY